MVARCRYPRQDHLHLGEDLPNATLPHGIVRLNDRLAKSYVFVSCVSCTEHENFHYRHSVVLVVDDNSAVDDVDVAPSTAELRLLPFCSIQNMM